MWSSECEDAFKSIIHKLTSAPVLGFADLSSPFLVHTDASNIGLGACLYQVQNGVTRVIAYASRGLSKSEQNYPAHKKEFLALKWAVTDKFHDYLYGGKFTVVTDNNPLTYVMMSAKLDATGYRWLAALSVYDFDLKYRRGLDHSDADGLSRRSHGPARSLLVKIQITSHFPIINLFQYHTMFRKCVKHYVAKDCVLLFTLKDITSPFPLSIIYNTTHVFHSFSSPIR